MHRHYSLDVIISTQRYADLDIKIKTLVKRISVFQTTIFPFTLKERRIKTLTDISEDETEIQQKFKWKFIIGGLRYHLAFPYWKYFNSYYRDKLLIKEWETWDKKNQSAYTKSYLDFK